MNERTAERALKVRSAVVLVGLIGAVIGTALFAGSRSPEKTGATPTVSTSVTVETTSGTVAPTSTSPTTTFLSTTTLPERAAGTVPGWTVGRPWGTTVGLTMFRGNPTRTYYGQGPLPENPRVLWSYPSEGGMCGSSSVGGVSNVWCGTGWTGQPVVWERSDGVTEVIFGAYDKAVHFLDATNGEETRPEF
ncbi:MAG: hypothetical protein Q8Q52_00605, partial [Acidimicrobiia bacterium]|nr:hypothetical protein [Acidimicrobiia bacterium]